MKHKAIVSDQNLVRREVYNPNAFTIEFRRIETKVPYIVAAGINPGPSLISCKPKDRCILNHAYYTPHTPLENWHPFNVIEIFGDDIGKGLCGPSRPGRNW